MVLSIKRRLSVLSLTSLNEAKCFLKFAQPFCGLPRLHMFLISSELAHQMFCVPTLCFLIALCSGIDFLTSKVAKTGHRSGQTSSSRLCLFCKRGNNPVMWRILYSNTTGCWGTQWIRRWTWFLVQDLWQTVVDAPGGANFRTRGKR